jgi:hypothetical protein
MRDEDYRGGSNKISAEGLSRPLSYGEKQAIAMQHKNRATDGMPPGEVEANNLKSITTTSGGLKTPKFPHLKWGGVP